MEYVLGAYEGPLDLLLGLIEKNEIDICDIPIASLTDQYLKYISGFTQTPWDAEPMRDIAEFIVMAATLLEIKSRMLLPRPPIDAEDAEDPREALVRKLLAYRQCQMLAEHLKNLPSQAERAVRLPSASRHSPAGEGDGAHVLDGTDLAALWRVFTETIARSELRVDKIHANFGHVPRERFSVEDKLNEIASALAKTGRVNVLDLFGGYATRDEVVVAFLAVLEMLRQNMARVSQRKPFGDIWLERVEARKAMIV